MSKWIDTQFFQRLKIKLLDIWWDGFNHLELKGRDVRFPVTTVSRTTWWLYISYIPWLRPNSTKESVRGSLSLHLFIIISLHEHVNLVIPKLLQSQNNFLKCYLDIVYSLIKMIFYDTSLPCRLYEARRASVSSSGTLVLSVAVRSVSEVSPLTQWKVNFRHIYPL